MRGQSEKQSSMLCLISPESRVPKGHPVRGIKALADRSLAAMSSVFDEMYSATGRPSIPPEMLLKSMLLMALYSVRSERHFCEQLDYDLLFRWFLDMDMVEDSFDASTFSKNRERLIKHEAAVLFLLAVVDDARRAGLVSDDHFSVDGTLIDAWASLKSFRPRDEDDDSNDGRGSRSNRWVNFHGEKRSNETHESKTDPEAKLLRKGLGKEAKLSFSAHALMENRNGLLVDFRIDEANGTCERTMAIEMLRERVPGRHRATVAADRGYDTRDFVRQCRELNITPHVATYGQSPRRRSAIDGRTTARAGYRISQRFRMRIEEIFGWMKTVANFRRSRWRGKARTQLAASMVAAAYNLLRIAKLSPIAT